MARRRVGSCIVEIKQEQNICLLKKHGVYEAFTGCFTLPASIWNSTSNWYVGPVALLKFVCFVSNVDF